MQIKEWLFNQQARKRQEWEVSLAWMRVRYTQPSDLKKCLQWLTASEKIQRVGILFHKGEEVSHLYIGIPTMATSVFAQMAQDYSFQTAPMPQHVTVPREAKLIPTIELNWERPFYAQLDRETLYIQAEKGDIFPTGHDKQTNVWAFPTDIIGLHPALDLNIYNGSENAFQSKAGWPLGFGLKSNTPLVQSGRINVYGSAEATGAWLEPVGMMMLSNPKAGIVVLDGVGNLVPIMKRQAQVVKRLETDLTYIEVDSSVVSSGFNPIAKAPYESDAAYLQRMQKWFVEMGLPRSSVALIEKAVADEVATFAELGRWVTLPKQQRMTKQIGRLKGVVNKLLAKRAVRDRLEWPTNPYETLPEGVLLFSCKQTGWEQEQMMYSLLLGIMVEPTINVILHGIRWSHIDDAEKIYRQLKCHNVIISNGPPLAGSVQVFTTSHPDRTRQISDLFFNGDERIEENLNLLTSGQSLLVNEAREIAMARWGGA